ncbi:MAG TPA: hypothetical protein ENG43_00580 [Candidatus Bathyarchaeota archaeon]|nr:hypothetical protein [Candidatus Bathyarchaeota archaeon]HEW89822.1 hypothetical protein [Candidatus Bathyarchaeota archaeon]
MAGGESTLRRLERIWGALASGLRLAEEDLSKLARLTRELLARRVLSYEEARAIAGDDLILLAHELGLIVPYTPGSRCMEWDANPLAPRARLELNPAVGAVLKSILLGGSVLEGLASSMEELGLDEDVALRLAEVALDLAGERVVSGSDVASSCKVHGLSGFESQAIAVLKAAGVISPLLSSSWPSGDVRYRTCALLALLTRVGL